MAFYTTSNRLKRVFETKRSSSIGVGTITSLVVVLMIFFAILPAYRSISDQIKNNEAKTKYNQDQITKKDTLDKLSQSYDANKVVIDYFNIYSNPIPDTENLLANISKLAKADSFILTNFSIASSTGAGAQKDSNFQSFSNITPQLLDLSFEGKLEGIAKLIDDLEKFPLTIGIKSINTTQKNILGSTIAKQSLTQNDIMKVTVSGEFYLWTQTY
jgi:hypothetical protein